MNTLRTALVVSMFASPLYGATTVFTDQLSWEAFATPQVTRESFESELVGELMSPTTLDSGLSVATSGAAVFMGVDTDDSPANTFGLQNTTFFGHKYLRFGLGSANGNYTVGFSTPVQTNAFAFNLSGWQPEIAVVSGLGVRLLDNGVSVSNFFIPSDNYLDNVFFGFHDDVAFDEVRLDIYALPLGNPIVLRQDVVAFDDVAWAGVPEPTTLSILGMGALMAFRRRRRG
ncbi:MAG TPA: PEP-CTERM sorting domain-containing protein [Phycisphaerae bacterium]|nr:PEP-CTERM sorting domain-containing protein [Phycisphaerae bacterium]HRW55423.1 PEP-CTERM sorting domain-containing protein [Phycisphaerae bacterium]